MTSSSATTLPPTSRRGARWTPGPWPWLALVGGLFLVVFWPVVQRIVFIAANGNSWPEALKNIATLHVAGDWSHALVIPFISLYFLKQTLPALRKILADPDPPAASFAPAIRVSCGMVALPALAAVYLRRTVGWHSPIYAGGWVVLALLLVAGVLGPGVARRLTTAGRTRLTTGLRGAGLLFFLGGIANFAWWLGPGRNDMLQGGSAIVALWGLLLFVLGPAAMSVLWLPVLYLALGVKISQRPWDWLAGNLRHIAAFCATVAINLLGLVLDIQADLKGSTIDLFLHAKRLEPLDIADACAGLHMLMAFIALGVALAFLGRRLWWQRGIMVAMTIPIAVLVNVGRIVVLALVEAFINPQLARGDFHLFIGMLMLLPAAGLFLLLGWVLDKMVIFDEDAATPESRREPALAPAAVTPPRREPWGRPAWLGFTLGALIAVLAGGLYTLRLLQLRPDLFSWHPPAGAVTVLRWGAWVLLGGVFVTLALAGRRWLHARAATQTLALALAAGVLLVSATGLQSMIRMTKTVLFKEEVPLRSPLFTLDKQIGPWRMTLDFPPMTEEMLQTLGTRHYIQRAYTNDHALTNTPGSDIVLHVAYYTGTPDTVPHVPERCFVGGGLEAVGSPYGAHVTLQSSQFQRDAQGGWTASCRAKPGTVSLPGLDIPVTVFRFVSPESPDDISTVVYFFLANGQYFPTPDDVRFRGFDPRDRYSYYCKVEMRWAHVAEGDDALRNSGTFLSDVLPEILACLPDWRQVQSGEYPPQP